MIRFRSSIPGERSAVTVTLATLPRQLGRHGFLKNPDFHRVENVGRPILGSACYNDPGISTLEIAKNPHVHP
jgi:hypothetical protein